MLRATSTTRVRRHTGVNIPVENGYINVTNGNLHLEFPLAQHPQRGALKLNERLVYDSHWWKIGDYSNYYWWPDNLPRTAQLAAGWRFESGADTGALAYNYGSYNQYECPGYPDQSAYSVDSYSMGFTWTDPDGTTHPFGVNYYINQYNCPDDPSPNSEFQTGPALDASGYTLSVSGDDQSGPQSFSIWNNSGTQVYPQIADRYGNYWSADSSGNLVDDRGQTPVITSYSGNQIFYDVLRQGGGRARYTVTTVQVTPHTQFGQQAVAEYPNGNNAQILNAVQSIQLPDGSSYQFQYENTFGMITGVTLSTGGQITYGWSNYTDSYNNVNHWLTSRTVGTDPPSTFTPEVVTTCGANQQNCHEQVTVHEPMGAETTYDMQLNNGAWNVNTRTYSGTASPSTLVSTTATTYDFSNPCSSACDGSSFVTAQSVTTTLTDTGLQRTDVYQYANNQLGLMSAKKVYDFYTGSLPSQPLQQTQYLYAGTAVPGDLSDVKQTDGSGNLISWEKYTYTTSAQSTSGLAGHNLSQSLGVYPQSTADWVSTDGSFITTNLTMDDAGTLHSQYLSAGGQDYPATTFTPDSSDTFNTGVTNPTVNGLALSSSSSPDATTGVPLSTSDYNGKMTTYTNYDGLNRVGEIDFPDGGYQKYSYSPISTFVSTRTSGADAISATQVDPYGRPQRTAVLTGQGSATAWYQTDTCYNSNGQVAFSSLRYAGPGWSQAPVCSGSGTQYTYDTFGRPLTVSTPDGTNQYSYRGRATSVTDVNGVQRITQIDGLGRTTAVCEVTGNANRPGTGSGSDCSSQVPGGMDITAIGFVTSYSYNDVNHTTTVYQGQQSRLFQTDSLGRTVYTAEPEAGSRATSTATTAREP